jgi:allophanate hydrolase
VPRQADLAFFGNDAASALFNASVERLTTLGGIPVEVDMTPFLEVARLLYGGPWVAERYAAVGHFVDTHPQAVFPAVRTIIEGGSTPTAAQAFAASYRLKALKAVCDAVWQQVDCLVTPTAGTIYRIEDMVSDPIRLNSNLGYYTNFMNLLDYSAVAVPAGFLNAGDAKGLPWGITLAAPAFRDVPLLRLADQFHRSQAINLGATSTPVNQSPAIASDSAPTGFTSGTVQVAVCGAHLSGLPLNHQLTSRGARLLRTVLSAPVYRFYELAGGPVKRPGMIQVEDGGVAVEMEIWELPSSEFGSFVAGIPNPLGIGKVKVQDGTEVCGFICEGYAVGQGGKDISRWGSWRAWLASQS